MRVLQINTVFAQGSTGKITQDIHNTLEDKGHESFVIYGDKSKNHNFSNTFSVSHKFTRRVSIMLNRFIGLQYGGTYLATRKIIRIIKRINPDIVHIQNINGGLVNIYKLFKFLANNKIKTVVSMHAEYFYTGSCGHAYECNKWKTGCGNCPRLFEATQSYIFDRSAEAWIRMKDSFKLFDRDKIIITSVSEWVNNRAKQSPILNGFDPLVVYNGIDKSVFKPVPFEYLSSKYNQERDLILLFVSASFNTDPKSNKGGHYIVKLAQMLKSLNVKIIVAANYGVGDDLPANMIYHGRTKTQQELAELYSMADLTVIASYRETFSMPVAESLCCGTPIVGFRAGGPENIALPNYSEFVEYGNISELYNTVLKWINVKRNQPYELNKLPKLAASIYAKEVMTMNFIDIYQRFS